MAWEPTSHGDILFLEVFRVWLLNVRLLGGQTTQPLMLGSASNARKSPLSRGWPRTGCSLNVVRVSLRTPSAWRTYRNGCVPTATFSCIRRSQPRCSTLRRAKSAPASRRWGILGGEASASNPLRAYYRQLLGVAPRLLVGYREQPNGIPRRKAPTSSCVKSWNEMRLRRGGPSSIRAAPWPTRWQRTRAGSGASARRAFPVCGQVLLGISKRLRLEVWS